jgi:hemoglobin-like flavoprotein
MLPAQRQHIEQSWAIAAAAPDELARCFYARLFEIDSVAARLFATTDMDAQRAKFVAMLDTVVRAIDEPRALVHGLAALGRRHAAYGATEQHYASVGEALLAALGATLGPAFTPDARLAWSEAYALVAAVMRRAGDRSPRDGAPSDRHSPPTREATDD